jgi:hypothetical protein
MKKVESVLSRSVGRIKRATRNGDGKKPAENLEDYALYGDFGGSNADEAPHIDIMMMASLTAALKKIGPEVPEACLQRAILPTVVSRNLLMARFISIFLLPARGAQETYGIRASILLADAHHVSGDFADVYSADSNDIFERGQHFSSVQDSFSERASWLRHNCKFLPVMRAMRNHTEYLKQLCECEIWDEQRRRDLISTITEYGLQECDTLPACKF